MALTENQKQILGMMTDAGLLTGDNRVAVASNDALAIEQLTAYKIEAIRQRSYDVLNAQTLISKLQAELAILQVE